MDDPTTSSDSSSGTALEGTASAHLARLRQAITTVYRSDGEAVELLLAALLAGGHVLLEDIPGVGKTTLARALAASVAGTLRRLQCTPDLMPSDITGVSIYDERDRRFRFHPGPVFCNVLVADELNRTPPRTQAALLEAMSERQVTIDGEARQLPDPFICIATQNPLDHAGTYPLPESQQDRFLLSFGLGYPDRDNEDDLLRNDGADHDLATLQPAVDLKTVLGLQLRRQAIRVSDPIRTYILDICAASRQSKSLLLGASPRAAIGLQRVCQATALLVGRDYVIPDDVQRMAVPALAHRISARVGQNPRQVVQSLVESLPVPR